MGPALGPWGLRVRAGTRAPSAAGVCSGLTCGGLFLGPFLVLAFPSPCGAVPTHPCKGLYSRQTALGPVGTQGVIARPLSPSQLPALHPTGHRVGGGRHSLNNEEGGKGRPGAPGSAGWTSRGGQGCCFPKCTWREHEEDREVGSTGQRHCWGGGQPGVLRAGPLDPRLFVPGNSKRDLGFGDRGTRAEVRRVEASAWSVKGQGEPHLRWPCHAWHWAGTPCMLSCLTLIHELREIPTSIHPRYTYRAPTMCPAVFWALGSDQNGQCWPFVSEETINLRGQAAGSKLHASKGGEESEPRSGPEFFPFLHTGWKKRPRCGEVRETSSCLAP